MIAIYPGSFDPITLGHLDIIKRSIPITDNLIVGILNNPEKKPLFTVEERVEHLKFVTKDMNVTITYFSGLLVEFAKKNNVNVIIRGLRAITDFESEFKMAFANRKLNENIETIMIPTSLEYLYISSSLVKEIASYDYEKIEGMVPSIIYEKMKDKMS
ncbi:MAG: pantetheine-phosphate adenylyltransferase [Defluviitaleaceae bacterium]|nr:pantetheine-phosphate adenylyltransferase [Defluviitaleaceae bacterium]